jgi:uncharacterized protein (DUF2147 family)
MRALLCCLALVVAGGVLVALPVRADTGTPAGLWTTVDDKTGKERSLVRIMESGGTYEGKVEKLLNREPDDDPKGLCGKCEGERKDQPIVGMTILWRLKKDGEQYTGGEILDPKNGKIYRARMKLLDGGKKLEVRGFIGFSLLGRSQTWLRAE